MSVGIQSLKLRELGRDSAANTGIVRVPTFLKNPVLPPKASKSPSPSKSSKECKFSKPNGLVAAAANAGLLAVPVF
jgi:hypothetical protein